MKRFNLVVNGETDLKNADWNDTLVSIDRRSQGELPFYYDNVYLVRRVSIEGGFGFNALDRLQLFDGVIGNDVDNLAREAFRIGLRFALQHPEVAQRWVDSSKRLVPELEDKKVPRLQLVR
jgi:hypothetical protein